MANTPSVRPAFVAQAAALLLPAAAILLYFQSGSQSSLNCGGRDVTNEIVRLFKRQLKLTPYARFIDVAKADVSVKAVFDVAAPSEASRWGAKQPDAKQLDVKPSEAEPSAGKACVAFATYHATLNEAGRQVEGHDRLQSSLLDELSGEKQIFYSVGLTPEGQRTVRISRISG